MTIPINFLTRYAIPLVVAALYLGDVDIPQQMSIFEKTSRLTDETLSKARNEGGSIETFDYIIVGGGSAGAILANRLTASGEHRVLLLEAGGDPNPVYEMPYARKFVYETKINDWNYTAVKQNKACATTDGYCRWPRGKALGGSSSINGLLYNRCKPKDYDHWANFTEDPSWSWKNIVDIYNSFEDYHGFHEESAGDRHGHGGELYVGKIDYIPGQEVFEEALREKGYPVGDLNGGEDFTYGFSKMDYNIKEGLRWGTYQAFLQPILNRTNLAIYRYAYATKIETIALGDLTYKAVGVTYQRHGATRTALVTKDVIVSAGVSESPKLLMLSGIGPKEHLDDVGIQTILDLPVGLHLQDHPGVDAIGFLVNTTFAKDPNTTESLLQFIQNGTGPLNQFRFASQIMIGYLNSSSNDDRSWPELLAYAIQRYDPDRNRQEFGFSVELVRSTSTGSVRLASKDANDKPLIDPNLLENPTDIDKLVDGIEIMMDIFHNSTTFKKYGIQQLEGSYHPCEAHDGRDYWKCVVEYQAAPHYHPTSTCRMGPNGTVAVLDSKMKVFGTQNLRVIDASSMPFVPSGNTNVPSILVGARGAEIIISEQ